MNFADYNNKLEYPSKSDFTITYFYFQGKCVATCHNSAEISAARASHPTAVTEKNVDQPGYSAAANAYDEESKRLRELFIQDLFAEHNIESNAFTRKVYNIAYQQGHSSGYGDIAACFAELIELDELARTTYGR